METPNLYERRALGFLQDGAPRDRNTLSGIGTKTLMRLLSLGWVEWFPHIVPGRHDQLRITAAGLAARKIRKAVTPPRARARVATPSTDHDVPYLLI